MQENTYEATINFKSKKPLDDKDKNKVKTDGDMVSFINRILYIVQTDYAIIIDDKEHCVAISVKDKAKLIPTLDRVIAIANLLALALSSQVATRSLAQGEKDMDARIEEQSIMRLVADYYAEKQGDIMTDEIKEILDDFTHIDRGDETYENSPPQKRPSWMFSSWPGFRASPQLIYTLIADDGYDLLNDCDTTIASPPETEEKPKL